MLQRARLATSLLALILAQNARAAEAGDVTIPFSLGTNVYTHQFAGEGKEAKDTTLNNSFQLSAFPGVGYFVTDRLRLGLNLQFTAVVREPAKPLPSRYATFGVLPQVNYNVWGPWTVSLVPSFYFRLQGISQYGFALQGVVTYALPLADNFAATASLEVPYYFTPYRTIGITPLIGVVYRLPR